MFEIGASLREAREARGLTLDDVQKALRLRERYLRALEDERWEILPGAAYARAFLRAYAEHLGLNGTLYVDELNARIAASEDEPIVPDSLAPRRGSTLLTRTIVGVLALGFVAFAATAWRPGAERPTLAAAAVAAPAKRLAAALPRTPAIAPALASPRRQQPKPAPKIALIRATLGQSWFSVRLGGPAGREIFRGFLDRGHSLRYRLVRKVWLRVGRPSAVRITIGTRPVRGLPSTPANVLLTNDGPLAG